MKNSVGKLIPNRLLSLIAFLLTAPLYVMLLAFLEKPRGSLFFLANWLFLTFVSLPVGVILLSMQSFQLFKYFYRRDLKIDSIGLALFLATIATILAIYPVSYFILKANGFLIPNFRNE